MTFLLNQITRNRDEANLLGLYNTHHFSPEGKHAAAMQCNKIYNMQQSKQPSNQIFYDLTVLIGGLYVRRAAQASQQAGKAFDCTLVLSVTRSDPTDEVVNRQPTALRGPNSLQGVVAWETRGPAQPVYG